MKRFSYHDRHGNCHVAKSRPIRTFWRWLFSFLFLGCVAIVPLKAASTTTYSSGVPVATVVHDTITIQSPNGNNTAIPISGTVSCSNCSPGGGGGSTTVTPGTGTWTIGGSATVTPGTGTWVVSGANSGSYTVTPGTGSFDGRALGSVTVTPGSGTWSVSGANYGSYTVTPGTGTFPVSGANTGSYTVTPGTGAYPIAGSITVTPGTGTFPVSGANYGSYTVTPGSGTWSVQVPATTSSIVGVTGAATALGYGVGSSSMPVNVLNIIKTQSGDKVAYSTTTATMTGVTAVSSSVLLAIWHPNSITKRYVLSRLDISQRAGGSGNGAQRIELHKIYGSAAPTGGASCSASPCNGITMDDDDPGTSAQVFTQPTLASVQMSSGAIWATDLPPGTSVQALIGDAILGMHRAGKYPTLQASKNGGWAIVQKVEAAITGAPRFIISLWWTEE